VPSLEPSCERSRSLRNSARRSDEDLRFEDRSARQFTSPRLGHRASNVVIGSAHERSRDRSHGLHRNVVVD
jgi:hypothetical protein